MKENTHIRKTMKERGVKLWQLADRMGVSETTMGRWMRHPFTPEKEAQIMAAIKEE